MGISGSSPYAMELSRTLRAVAEGAGDLSLIGEPGSGKRFIARIIHQSASPNPASFISIGPSIDEEELRAILFDEGRERMEGVLGREIPTIREDGTVYLQNIHELSVISQTRVAMFLVQRTSERRARKRVRAVLGLSRRWSEEGEKKMVIESLQTFVRSVPTVEIPPLRERKEDIPDLVRDILQEICSPGNSIPLVEPETIQRLMDHPWQDNIRELKVVLQDAMLSSSGDVLTLPPTFFDEITVLQEIVRGILAGKKCHLEESMEMIERTLIRRALARTGNDRAKAARLLGMSDANLRYRLRKQKFALPPQANTRSRRS